MDSSMETVPPLPRQSSARQQHSRRRDGQTASSTSASRSTHHVSSRAAPAPPIAGPDVISSLITSLDIGSRPANPRLDRSSSPIGSLQLSTSPPKSPGSGSFGVDYGAFKPSVLDDSLPEEEVSLDNLAASPPVIRRAKPPSGFSSLTSPKSPKEESGGLKSLLGSRSASRPSSKGSLASRDADTQSIGNLSVERGTVPSVPELKKQRSHDSWGKKQGRAHKGLMYMRSHERLRDKEDKKRASIGAVGGDRLGSGPTSPRQDPILAEIPISEEPMVEAVLSASKRERHNSAESPTISSPRPIPTRDSSLRKTGSGSKRSSGTRRSVRDSEAANVIPEEEQNGSTRPRETSRRKHHQSRQDSDAEGNRPKMGTDAPSGRGRPNGAAPSATKSRSSQYLDANALPSTGSNRNHTHRHQHLQDINTNADDADIEEGAPSPAVAQGRRRDRSLEAKRRSGIITPDTLSDNGARTKQPGGRMKRLSTHGTPRSPTPDAAQHVVYERPPSADSIDDAVESYLCSPRLSQKIKHPQTGRVISFSEVGDSDGCAVFCCVGMGLTRYITAFYDELALTLKLRLITPDRPGVGDSEPYLDGTATPLSWPDDVYAICQALKITKFSILAHSAGAIYALATALRMPQHIRGRIHLLAPWIPPSQMSVFGASAQTPLPPTNAIPTSQRILRALPTPFLKAANSSFMTATSSSITSSLPKTPRKKRKSNANAAKEREKHQSGNAHPPLPAGGSSPDGNKENRLQEEHAGGDRPPTIPRKENTASEEMDLIRPANFGVGGGIGSPSALEGAGNHKRSPSTASAAHAAREAAVLAAAASALEDRERQVTYDTRLTHAIWDLATTGANPAVDLLVCLERRHTIGFRYVDITRPVVIHHGSRDTRVPVENVRWLGKTMRRCEVRVLEGEGHGLMASAQVMAAVLMEIAKEWEDWTRLTSVGGAGARANAVRERELQRERDRERDRVGVAR